MTGTAETEAGEFWEIYKLDVVAIPTNRPIARQDKNDFAEKGFCLFCVKLQNNIMRRGFARFVRCMKLILWAQLNNYIEIF